MTGTVTKIVYWWDGRTCNWITQAVDDAGNQIGQAEYSPNRKGRQLDCKALAKEHGVTRIERKELEHYA